MHQRVVHYYVTTSLMVFYFQLSSSQGLFWEIHFSKISSKFLEFLKKFSKNFSKIVAGSSSCYRLNNLRIVFRPESESLTLVSRKSPTEHIVFKFNEKYIGASEVQMCPKNFSSLASIHFTFWNQYGFGSWRPRSHFVSDVELGKKRTCRFSNF